MATIRTRLTLATGTKGAPLEGEGDLVAQVKGKRHSEDVKDPPARFIPHYVF